MGKKQTKRTVETPDMLTQKTYEDYNKKKPSLNDPNESKGKVNPERPNLADESKDILKAPKQLAKKTIKQPRHKA
jgi:hypothetical protein